MIQAQQLQKLTPTTGSLICKLDNPVGSIEVRQLNDIRWLHQGGDAIQAVMSLNDPHNLMLPYSRAMLLALCLAPYPDKLLNLGLGGGMFVRFFEEVAPRLKIVSVDNRREMLDIMQKHFPTQTNSKIHIIDAEAFVSIDTETYDMILCDLFDGSCIPDCLFEGGFFKDCAARLATKGILSINILAIDQQELTRLLVSLRQSLPCVAILEVADFQNIILFASRQPYPSMRRIRKQARIQGKLQGIDFSAMLDKLVMLPERQ